MTHSTTFDICFILLSFPSRNRAQKRAVEPNKAPRDPPLVTRRLLVCAVSISVYSSAGSGSARVVVCLYDSAVGQLGYAAFYGGIKLVSTLLSCYKQRGTFATIAW